MNQILFAICLLLLQTSNAQNKDAIKCYNQAIYDKGLNKIDEAILSLQKAIQKDPTYLLAHFELGRIYLAQLKYKEAITPFLYIHQSDTNYTPVLLESLGDAYFGSDSYREAAFYYNKYINHDMVDLLRNPYIFIKLAHCEFCLSTKLFHAVTFENMGPSINTSGEEYFPSTNANESKLYFTHRKSINFRDDEDIYVTSYENKKWKNATPIIGPINTNENEGAHTISPNGKFLIFTSCNRKNQFVQTNSCDLYISKKNGDIWSNPNFMAATINTNAWESQPTIAADGKTIFFVSNRTGGYGGLDIWYCELDDKGNFGLAINAGSEINTKFDEEKPFMHPDGETFYFVSNGHAGYGKKDIFKTKKLNNIWLSPQNIGKPFNSHEDENGIFINALGTKGYIASNRVNGLGGMDIYTFEVPESIRPRPTSYIVGVVKDENNIPKAAKGSIHDFITNKVYYTFSTDSITGEYIATLPTGKKYFINIYKDGYLFQTEKIDLLNSESKEIQHSITLSAIEKGKKMTLKNTYFDVNKFILKDESFTELDRVVEFMNQNTKVRLEIAGHTDNTGDAVKNKLLSQQRAEAVMNYLIKQGIDVHRLKAVGYGSEKSIADNATEEGKAKNRRTEIIIH